MRLGVCCQVAGLLVVNAHLVQDSSGEGFAVRLFRKGNQRGFVRALSDQPSAFVSGFGKVRPPDPLVLPSAAATLLEGEQAKSAVGVHARRDSWRGNMQACKAVQTHSLVRLHMEQCAWLCVCTSQVARCVIGLACR